MLWGGFSVAEVSKNEPRGSINRVDIDGCAWYNEVKKVFSMKGELVWIARNAWLC